MRANARLQRLQPGFCQGGRQRAGAQIKIKQHHHGGDKKIQGEMRNRIVGVCIPGGEGGDGKTQKPKQRANSRFQGKNSRNALPIGEFDKYRFSHTGGDQ